MFGIGITEIIVATFAAYLVIGPKHAFRLVREIRYYWGKFQTVLNRWKAEINQVIEVEDKLKRDVQTNNKLIEKPNSNNEV